jgi:hypothetical protein
MAKLAIGFLLLAGVLAAAPQALADQWKFDPVKAEKNYKFGDVTVSLTVDATMNQQFPDLTLRILKKGELQAQYRGIAFDDLFASPDNKVFVALSNQFVTRSAIVVFDAEGQIIVLVNHTTTLFDYCRQSVTLLREWYDHENPDIRFGDPESKPSGISLRDCRGKRIDLIMTAMEANERTLTEVFRADKSR